MSTRLGRFAAQMQEHRERCEKLLNTPVEDAPRCGAAFAELRRRMPEFVASAIELRQRIAQQDPNKKVYGKATEERVAKLLEQFEALHTAYEEELLPAFGRYADRFEESAADENKGAAGPGAAGEEDPIPVLQRIGEALAKRSEGDPQGRQRSLGERPAEHPVSKLYAELLEEEASDAARSEAQRVAAAMAALAAEDTAQLLRQLTFLEDLVDAQLKKPHLLTSCLLRVHNKNYQENFMRSPGARAVLRLAGFKAACSPERVSRFIAAFLEANPQLDEADNKLDKYAIEEDVYWLYEEPSATE